MGGAAAGKESDAVVDLLYVLRHLSSLLEGMSLSASFNVYHEARAV